VVPFCVIEVVPVSLDIHRMLLWCVKRHEVVVYISGNVPLQAPNDLRLERPSLVRRAAYSRALVMAQQGDGDQVERAVGLAGATTVESMAVGLAGGGGNRGHDAKIREGRFRPLTGPREAVRDHWRGDCLRATARRTPAERLGCMTTRTYSRTGHLRLCFTMAD
jgi:hypothetical protein